MKKISLQCICFLFSIISFFSCKIAFLPSDRSGILDDTTPPKLFLDEPTVNGHFGTAIYVKGHIEDQQTHGLTLKYKINVVDKVGYIPVDDNGYFNDYITDVSHYAMIDIDFIAKDPNGNKDSIKLTLLPGSFKSLKAVGGNKKVTLKWAPVNYAEGYTIYYTANGAIPYKDNPIPLSGDDIEVRKGEISHTISNLTNGVLYRFKIVSHSNNKNIPDDVSEVLNAIPLSPMSLNLTVSQQYGMVKLHWRNLAKGWSDLPGTRSYTVQRRDTPVDPLDEKDEEKWKILSSSVQETNYTDHSVEYGKLYLYRVVFNLPGSVWSYPVAGGSFPVKPLFELMGGGEGLISNLGTNSRSLLQEIKNKDNIAYMVIGNELVVYDLRFKRKISSIDFSPEHIVKIDQAGDRLAIVTTDNMLNVYGLANPESPEYLDTVVLDNIAGELVIREGVLYLSIAQNGLLIVDSRDEDNVMVIKDHYNTASELDNFLCRGDFLVYRERDLSKNELKIVVSSLTDPLNPHIQGRSAHDKAIERGLWFNDDHTVLYYSRLVLYKSDLKSEYRSNISRFYFGSSTTEKIKNFHFPGSIEKVFEYGDFIYIINNNANCMVFGKNTQTYDLERFSFPYMGVSSLAYYNNNIYLGIKSLGIILLDTSHNPKNAEKILLQSELAECKIALAGLNTVYFLKGNKIDIGKIDHIRGRLSLVNSITVGIDDGDIKVHGNRLIIHNSQKILFYDITNLHSPKLLGKELSYTNIKCVEVLGDACILSTEILGIVVLDISATPEVIFTYSYSLASRDDIGVFDQYFFFGSGNDVVIFNMNLPGKVQYYLSYELSYFPVYFNKIGDNVLVKAETSVDGGGMIEELDIFNIPDPHSPWQKPIRYRGCYEHNMNLAGDYTFEIDHLGVPKMRYVNVSKLSSPLVLEAYSEHSSFFKPLGAYVFNYDHVQKEFAMFKLLDK